MKLGPLLEFVFVRNGVSSVLLIKGKIVTGDASDILYANQEEKPVAEQAIASFEVDVTEQADLSQWDYEGGALTPCRKVLILDGSKFNNYIRLIKEEVESV